MFMTIDDFKSHVRNVARPNRFIVQVLPSPFVWKSASLSLSSIIDAVRFVSTNPINLTFMCKGAQIPGRSIGVVEHKRNGVTHKFGGDSSHEDLTLTFLADESWAGRVLFENWMEQIANNRENTRGYVQDYTMGSKIIVMQMGANNLPICIYNFENVFPHTISTIDLNSESSDQLAEFTVSLQYSYWDRVA